MIVLSDGMMKFIRNQHEGDSEKTIYSEINPDIIHQIQSDEAEVMEITNQRKKMTTLRKTSNKQYSLIECVISMYLRTY